MRKQYLASIALGSVLVIGVVIVGVGLTRPAPDPPTPMTPVVVGAPRPILPPQPIRQTIRGYTLTLVPIYADANRITVTYTIDGPRRAYPSAITVGDYAAPAPRLTGRDGTDFAWRREAGDTSLPGTFDYTTGQLVNHPATLVFDGAPGPTTAVSVPLHLDLPLRISDATYFPPPPTAANPPLITPPPRPAPEIFTLTFALDFSVPFDPRRRVAEVGQSVLAAGVTITLERVVVTASETRLVLGYGDYGDDQSLWFWGPENAAGSLIPGAGTLPVGLNGLHISEPCDPAGRCTASYSAASLFDQPPTWTLRLDQLLGSTPHAPPSLPGPWVFSFILPPLNLPATP